jgi:predicted transcriptional regulator
MINKQQFEAQLQHIFRLLLENKTQEEIAHELNISTRTVARYTQRIDQRYGEIQRQKNDDTLFLECHLFKNRMLKLYKALENKVLDNNTSGAETAKCAEVAANLAIDVLKIESEGIRAVTEIISKNNNSTNKGQRGLANLGSSQLKNDDESDDIKKEYNPNRKF